MGGINHTLELGLGRWMEEGEGHDGWDQSYIRAHNQPHVQPTDYLCSVTSHNSSSITICTHNSGPVQSLNSRNEIWTRSTLTGWRDTGKKDLGFCTLTTICLHCMG